MMAATGLTGTGGRRPARQPGNNSPEAAMCITRFLPLSRTEAGAAASVLCLAATVAPETAGDLGGAVLARLAGSGCEVGTVVLVPDGDIDAAGLETMCTLHERLRARGIRLYLVIGTPETAQLLRTSTAGTTVTALAVHPSLRSAVLAACAALPGPGLVNAQIRAVLSAPVERLCPAPDQAHAAAAVVHGPS
jgi:hypothetical protein